jgi:hypothetical protein
MKTITLSLLSTACLFVLGPSFAEAQGIHRDPIQHWRQTSQGMSSTAALAHYRLQNTAVRHQPIQAQLRDQRYTTPSSQYLGPRPTPTGPVGLGAYHQPYRHNVSNKPFANVQQPQTAMERYWPLLLEGRQDTKSGLIIWSLP